MVCTVSRSGVATETVTWVTAEKAVSAPASEPAGISNLKAACPGGSETAEDAAAGPSVAISEVQTTSRQTAECSRSRPEAENMRAPFSASRARAAALEWAGRTHARAQRGRFCWTGRSIGPPGVGPLGGLFLTPRSASEEEMRRVSLSDWPSVSPTNSVGQ